MNKALYKQMKKSEEKVNKTAANALAITYTATILALYRYYGWRDKRLNKFMDVSKEVYADCSGMDTSMVEMCYKETGIEMRSITNECYKDTPYLCAKTWNDMKEKWYGQPEDYKVSWMIRKNQKMCEWLKPQIAASVALALHRKEGWGIQRVAEFCGYMEEIWAEFKEDKVRLIKAVKEETGLEFIILKNGDLALKE